MPRDLVEVACCWVDALEQGDVPAANAVSGLVGWDPGPWIAEAWRPDVEELAGSGRTVSSARQVNDRMVRVVLVGERGQAFVSVVLDEDAKVVGTSVGSDEHDGRFWVVVGCPEEREDELRAFYTMLTHGRIGTGEGRMRPPRWRDPAHPTQIHLDVLVADLEAAERAALEHGATKLEEFPGWRVYADPVGHPFCLYPGLTESTDRFGTLVRVVIDCADPIPLARFWGGVLDMRRTVENSPDRVVIARDDDRLPMIALQRVPDYHPPRWPDPDFPPQMHFDIGFDDRAEKERLALALGGTLLPPQGGSCPVYADPAGHPFCLCYKGE
ncbi:VOC family protein [Kribbella sp. VKM Ac-2571]|uniref:VOC family protein n=1 Tax=Kribbella sp. VKM Ac-2571 TaxID=2512222 RepID=UPI00105DEBA7|nr:VOC family protein [Kribbella sp. VKM Ac-2571]